MPTKVELTLEQSQQGPSDDVLVTQGVEYGKEEIFSSSSLQECESAVINIDRSLTDDERQANERRVKSSEVYEALIQMVPSKAPGPDGMTVKGALALKIDMSKAYDRVEWPFIRAVLSKFGFPLHFSKLIMDCVFLISFSFNINGQVSSHVTPTRGLGQGDPISPYIFVMCAEVLSSMVRKSITKGHIHGVKVCRGALEISHMFFADDNIFFTRSSVEESCRLKSIFTRYCQASGQVINYEKSKISFSANVDIHTRTRIIECLNVHEVVHQDTYLGMPLVIGRFKKLVFEAILDKIKKKLGGWKEKTLPIARKEVLIKSVAQAMPMVKENPIRCCKWERMYISKFRVGLGFRHLGLFNRSLLEKQVWRLITSPTKLAARILKAHYFPRSSFFDANIRYRPNYIWHSFLSVKDIVHKGCKWNIGDGRSVKVWNDFWVDDHRILGDGWNHELMSSLFLHIIASKITCCFVKGAATFHDFCRLILDSCRAKWEIFMMIMWRLWLRRRKRFHGQLNDREGNVKAIAKLLLSEHHMANQREIITGTNRLHNTHMGVWSRPEADNIKVNCDAPWQNESEKAGWGFVARGYNRKVLFSYARLEYYTSSLLEAEAKAVHWAMSHALSRG
nr:ribonuclease H [Tanacetum cinerariifolium]